MKRPTRNKVSAYLRAKALMDEQTKMTMPTTNETFKAYEKILSYKKEAAAAAKILGRGELDLSNVDAIRYSSLSVMKPNYIAFKAFLRGLEGSLRITNQAKFAHTVLNGNRLREHIRDMRTKWKTPSNYSPKRVSITLSSEARGDTEIVLVLNFVNKQRLQFPLSTVKWVGDVTPRYVDITKLEPNTYRYGDWHRFTINILDGKISVKKE